MDSGTHFAFGPHLQHGFVAAFNPSLPAHVAHWFLVREQFQSLPDQPDLFRLIEPERDGPRRTRQAIQDLRSHGFTVHVDTVLDPTASAGPPCPTRPNGLAERRSRIARAATDRSLQRGVAPVTSLPTTTLATQGNGRSR
ncbi:hypothetical protein [Streptomyces meridianus]|uniref:Uncharacterized protein n=1 Tax=Streptomyces meridianus TaxID=2938945 RepID=A0ABT0XAY9_9ACTN|nr:hypothetical protein [Streptomyces meridianus]MCM2579691.1 hypothetical protein [Streptomyces meridianus]